MRITRLKKLIFILCCFFLSGAAFPASKSYINDFADIIDNTAEQQLNALAYELDQKSGAQFTVVTVTSLSGSNIDDYAWQLFEKWGIGKKGEDTGVLLLIAPNERKVRIEVGYGFEGAITDGIAGEIIRNSIIPYFKSGDMSSGILSGSIKLLSMMASEQEVSLTGNTALPVRVKEKPSPLAILFKIIFIFLIFGGRFFIFPFFFPMGRGYYSNGGGGFGGFGGFGGGLSGGGGAGGSW